MGKDPNTKDLETGDLIRVSAQISTFPGFRNFNSVTSENFKKISGLHNRAHTKSPLLVQKIRSGSPFSLLRRISYIRKNLQDTGEEYKDSH